MSMQYSAVTFCTSLVVVFALSIGPLSIGPLSIGPMEAFAQTGHHGHRHGAHAGHDHGSAMRVGDAPRSQPSPHGGKMTTVERLCFEVVYRPKETRVYLYQADHRPIRAEGVRGQISLKVQGNEKVFRYPLSYIAPKAGSTRQDYLATKVDVSRIRDGQMAVTLELDNLPDRQHPRATLTQTFALSNLPVTLGSLNASDRPRIEQQKICPVMGGKLGSMGTPIKIMIGDQPIYLCCKGCIGKVQQNPELYLEKVYPDASDGQLMITQSTAADQAGISQQRVCVVSGGQLGSMGTPIKITRGGKSLFLCCKGCLGKVEKNPAPYMAKAAELRSRK